MWGVACPELIIIKYYYAVPIGILLTLLRIESWFHEFQKQVCVFVAALAINLFFVG
jgi:hypothetical protein